MKNTMWQKTLLCTGVLLLASRFGYSDSPEVRISGIINDHTAVTAGSWELHGEWSLNTKGNGTGDFSAVLTMERSDYWAVTSGGDPNARSPHTHHITLDDATVTSITGGFEVSGTAAITGNGNPAPFGLYSPVVIDITGGDTVAFSNIKVTFQGAAAGHFGSAPLSGAVRVGNDPTGALRSEGGCHGREQ